MSDIAIKSGQRRGVGSDDRPLTSTLWERDTRPQTAAMSEPGDDQPDYPHVDYKRYYDPAFAALEYERMWPRTWLFACREEDLPEVGDRLPFDVGPLSFLIVHSAPGEYRAFYNACSHRGTRLCEHKESGETIRCPYHFWEWKTDGRLKRMPGQWDFLGVSRSDAALREIRLGCWGGYIMINGDPEVPPLEDVLSVIPSHFSDFGSEDRYTAAHFRKTAPANWKLAMEAFQEAYHLPAVHPEAIPFSGDSQSQYDLWKAGGGHVGRVVTPGGIPGMAAAPDASALGATEAHARNLQAWRHPTAELPRFDPAQDLRAQLAAWHRNLHKEAFDRSVKAPDAVMVDSLLYYMFPNLIVWLSETVPFVYRFLPHETDPLLSYFEGRMLLPWPAGGERPKPATRIDVAVDQSIFKAVPALGFTGWVLDQDMDNIRRVQAGVRAADPKHRRSNLGTYQEMLIQRWHELLDRYIQDDVANSQGP